MYSVPAMQYNFKYVLYNLYYLQMFAIEQLTIY